MLIFLIALLLNNAHAEKINPIGTDTHMHVQGPKPEFGDMDYGAGRALFAVESSGLNRAIIISNGYYSAITEKEAQTENTYIAVETKKNPKRLVGACSINPKTSWAAQELKRCKNSGLKVLKLHLVASGIDLKNKKDIESLQNILKLAEEEKFTVLVHGNYPFETRDTEIAIFIKTINDFSKVKFIIAHAMGKDFEHLIKINNPNVLFEISAIVVQRIKSDRKQEFVNTIRKIGIDKFLFGSDWPVIHPSETIYALKQFPFSEEELKKITITNASQLNYLFQ
ncbi:MAG: TatD family hydrolase [Bdellovibrionota bacterium]